MRFGSSMLAIVLVAVCQPTPREVFAEKTDKKGEKGKKGPKGEKGKKGPKGEKGKKGPKGEKGPKASGLSLSQYVRSYLKLDSRLRQGQIEIQKQEIEVLRRQRRGTMELSATPAVGLHNYHYTSAAGSDLVGVGSATVDWTYARDNGQSVSAQGRVSLPTRQGSLAGEVSYGVSAAYTMPLLRNRFGRQFRMEAEAQRHLKDGTEATLEAMRLDGCRDAIRRFIERYVAQEQLRVFQALLREKRRIWRQTAADYHKKMITRLDLLAAKSDWLAAQSREPHYLANLARADAALRAYYPGVGAIVLAPPRGLTPGTGLGVGQGAGNVPGQSGASSSPGAPRLQEERHPLFKELLTARRALETQQHLLMEQNRSDLDLGLSLGLDRYHRSFDPRLDRADITDLGGLVSLSYLFPIKRPDTAYRLQLLHQEQQALKEQQAALRRDLLSRAQQAAALARESAKSLALLEQQARLADQQLKEAYREFRNGKLQFQSFLDHWAQYQTARLGHWDAQRQIWLTAADLIPLLNQPPEVCR